MTLALQLSNSFSVTNTDYDLRDELYDLFIPQITACHFAENLGTVHIMRDGSVLISALNPFNQMEMIVCDDKEIFLHEMTHLIESNPRWLTEIILPTLQAAQ